MKNLEEKLGLSFRDKRLLECALTHRSFAHESAPRRTHYERLEFLGDAALKFVIAEQLYVQFQDKEEGELSRLLSVYISDALLSKKARSLGLQKHLVLGKNERLHKGEEIDSILADSLEAIFGACYLDQGLAAVKKVIHALYTSIFEGTENLDEFIDYKTMLQELTQAKGLGRPTYTVQKEDGPDHSKFFTIEAQIISDHKEEKATGKGKSKKIAEQNAANRLLAKLKELG